MYRFSIPIILVGNVIKLLKMNDECPYTLFFDLSVV